MPTLKLTKRNVDTLKPAAERFTAWDTDVKGFGLRVTPSGERVYVLKYRIAGVEKLLSLGNYPDTSLQKARAKRDAARTLLASSRRQDDGPCSCGTRWRPPAASRATA